MFPLIARACLLIGIAAVGVGCGDESGGDSADDDASAASSGAGTGGAGCETAGKPEMTGPITGLKGSYLAGDPMDVGVPVDEDTARVIVGVYEVGSKLYLGGTAEDAAANSTRTLSFFAGVANGAVGTFYLSVELCTTSECTTPFVRNTYDRADREAPELGSGETYVQTRENVGAPADPETCPTDIAIQSFRIE